MLIPFHKDPCSPPAPSSCPSAHLKPSINGNLTVFPSFGPGAPPPPPPASSTLMGKLLRRLSADAHPVPLESQLPTPPAPHSNVHSPIEAMSLATPPNYKSDTTKIVSSITLSPHGIFTHCLPPSHHLQLCFQLHPQPSHGTLWTLRESVVMAPPIIPPFVDLEAQTEGAFRCVYFILRSGLVNDLILMNRGFLVLPIAPFTALTASAHSHQVMRLMQKQPLPLSRPTSSPVQHQCCQSLRLGHPHTQKQVRTTSRQQCHHSSLVCPHLYHQCPPPMCMGKPLWRSVNLYFTPQPPTHPTSFESFPRPPTHIPITPLNSKGPKAPPQTPMSNMCAFHWFQCYYY